MAGFADPTSVRACKHAPYQRPAESLHEPGIFWYSNGREFLEGSSWGEFLGEFLGSERR